jgi:hypothetical protein
VRKQILPGAWDLLEMAYFTEQGTWPCGGGVLDQSAAYLASYRWVRGEKAAVELEMMEPK